MVVVHLLVAFTDGTNAILRVANRALDFVLIHVRLCGFHKCHFENGFEILPWKAIHIPESQRSSKATTFQCSDSSADRNVPSASKAP